MKASMRIMALSAAAIIATVVLLVYLINNSWERISSSINNLGEVSLEVETPTIKADVSKAQSLLIQNDIQAIIDRNRNISVSVAVTDIDDDITYLLGEKGVFKGASTVKVLTGVYFMHRMQSGNVTLTQRINGEPASSLLQRMLNKSDNPAWHSLTDYLGDGNIESYARSIGMSSFRGDGYNTLTASDMTLLLRKLHKGELINVSYRDHLYAYMRGTNNEKLIPAAVPTGAVVTHKWGLLEGNLHDAGIVEYNGRTYVITIFTSISPSQPAKQTAIIHDIVRAIVGK